MTICRLLTRPPKTVTSKSVSAHDLCASWKTRKAKDGPRYGSEETAGKVLRRTFIFATRSVYYSMPESSAHVNARALLLVKKGRKGSSLSMQRAAARQEFCLSVASFVAEGHLKHGARTQGSPWSCVASCGGSWRRAASPAASRCTPAQRATRARSCTSCTTATPATPASAASTCSPCNTAQKTRSLLTLETHLFCCV